MGVKLLNKLLKSKCNDNDSIKKMHLRHFRGKKIAIDTSIYMYRYEGDNMLYEGFYNMCSLFLKYNIIPLFIFDGKPPKEKKDELEHRKNDKKHAEIKYKKIQKILKNVSDPQEKEELEQQMDVLRKQFLRIKQYQKDIVKNIIDGFGFKYELAYSEADELCAYLALKQQVYAVLSEDMDMFVYGCPRIIRYFSLTKHNCVMYTYSNIIEELKINDEHFKELCIISGTDYFKNDTLCNIFHYYKQYLLFKETGEKTQFNDFINENHVELENIKNIFKFNQKHYLQEQMQEIQITKNEIDMNTLQNIMEKDNFIFI
jgi:flap endonuclease-1